MFVPYIFNLCTWICSLSLYLCHYWINVSKIRVVTIFHAPWNIFVKNKVAALSTFFSSSDFLDHFKIMEQSQSNLEHFTDIPQDWMQCAITITLVTFGWSYAPPWWYVAQSGDNVYKLDVTSLILASGSCTTNVSKLHITGLILAGGSSTLISTHWMSLIQSWAVEFEVFLVA